MDLHEREYIATAVNYFWGQGTVTPSTVNEGVAQVTYKALEEAGVCSDSMDLVPRPAYGALDIKYIIKQVAMAGQRITNGEAAFYQSCRGRAAINYKPEIAMALMGVY